MSSKSQASAEFDTAPLQSLDPTHCDRDAIREQLKRVLESAPFRTSKRCPALLNYVVEKVLAGNAEPLKERSLGIEVFRRDPQYDTSDDPVVRIAAGEVRKRLAQYYYDPSHQREIRIELPAGSYVPEFYKPADDSAAVPTRTADLATGNPSQPIAAAASIAAPRFLATGRTRRRVLVPVLCVILGFLAGALSMRTRKAVSSAPLTALDEFWQPLTTAPGNVWLCIGESYVSGIELDPNGARNRFETPYSLNADVRKTFPALNLADSTALARVAGLLQNRGKNYSVHGETETAFSDLASAPSVLIGSFNNDWTIRLTDQLRFHFEMDQKLGEQWIVDRQKPSEKIGIHSFNLAAPDTADAYAIISRVRDASTGQMVVALAGVSANGTKAAGAFVSDPNYLEEFAKQAPSNWQYANLQIVVAASIVDGSLGPPHVISAYEW